MKKIILITLAIAFTFGNINAQTSGKKGKCKNPELKSEMNSYFQQNMYPVLKEKHNKMDASFSKKDFANLQQLRAESAVLKDRKKAILQNIKTEHKAENVDRETLKEKYRAQFEELHVARKAIAEKARPILENNQEMIAGIMVELKPHHEKWHDYRKTMAEKYGFEGKEACQGKGKRTERPNSDRPQRPEKEGSIDKEEGHRPHGDRGGKHGERSGNHKMKHTLKFVLWDGNMDSSPENTNLRSNDQNNLSLDQNYPNPAINTTTLSFTLPKDFNNVQLDIVNLQGKTVQHRSFSSLNKGQHSEQIDISGLAPGTYMYTITAGSYSQTKKMVIGAK